MKSNPLAVARGQRVSPADGMSELLAAHFRRFQASHERARGQAGPSLFGSDRAVDHWTFDYAKQAIDEATADAVGHTLREGAGGDPVPALRRFVDEVYETLQSDANQPPANEFGLRPSPAALETVRRHGAERLSMARASLESGRLDPRLRPARRHCVNDRILLIAVVAAVLLAVLAVI